MIKLIHGDCLIEMPKLAENSVDLTVTSPPYDNLRTYNNSLEWNPVIWKRVIEDLFWLTKEGGVVVWVVADGTENGSRTGTSANQMLFFMEIGFRLHQRLFYEKAGPPPDPTRYEETIEEMFVFSKGKPKTINLIKDKRNRWAGHGQFGQKSMREKDGSLTKKKAKIVNEYGKRTSVWRYATGAGYSTKDSFAFDHPAIFPEKLARDHIISWSNPGELVFDPFMGSCTTGKMAVQTGRDFIGIEKDAGYFEISQKRIAAAQPALF